MWDFIKDWGPTILWAGTAIATGLTAWATLRANARYEPVAEIELFDYWLPKQEGDDEVLGAQLHITNNDTRSLIIEKLIVKNQPLVGLTAELDQRQTKGDKLELPVNFQFELATRLTIPAGKSVDYPFFVNVPSGVAWGGRLRFAAKTWRSPRVKRDKWMAIEARKMD